ncbi:hypothetical protein ACHAWF_002353 [Thalassiosira exigua]
MAWPRRHPFRRIQIYGAEATPRVHRPTDEKVPAVSHEQCDSSATQCRISEPQQTPALRCARRQDADPENDGKAHSLSPTCAAVARLRGRQGRLRPWCGRNRDRGECTIHSHRFSPRMARRHQVDPNSDLEMTGLFFLWLVMECV